jgi:hypothetical protein
LFIGGLFIPSSSLVSTVAKFKVPDWRDKVDSGKGGRQAGTTTLCRSQLYPSVKDKEFGYCADQLVLKIQKGLAWLKPRGYVKLK